MATILVVEDNPQNLKLTKVILESAGHTVLVADTATAAESEISKHVPDLILMDLALPGKDGYTLTRELRHRTETARLPILAVSSFAMPGDAEAALAAGCTAYLTKPIRRATLLERVDQLLGTRRSNAASKGASTDPPPAIEPDPTAAAPVPPAAAGAEGPLPSEPAPAVTSAPSPPSTGSAA
jgi:two-component system, cell cycle response regulator DivK